MRTDHIFEQVTQYVSRLEKKLKKTDSSVHTLLGDSILLAASVVYLGPFSPEEREGIRATMIDQWQRQSI